MARRKKKISEDVEIISKSQRKRDALELKSLASKLIKLAPVRLAKVPLDDSIREAIEEARQIRSHVAGKRQLQFVAKQLRRIDATEILAFIDADQNDARQLTARQHRAEAWRDFLINSGDSALEQLLAQRQNVDAQPIRQLIRNARREAQAEKPPTSARALFRILRDMDTEAPLSFPQA